jgi:hypothetical protein
VALELAIGGHQLEVNAPGYQLFRTELVIAGGQDRTINAVLELPPRRARFYEKWYFWTPIVVAAGGVAVGLGVGLTRQSPITGTLAPGVGPVN